MGNYVIFDLVVLWFLVSISYGWGKYFIIFDCIIVVFFFEKYVVVMYIYLING